MCRAPNGIANLTKPAGCATKGSHTAYADVWIENGELQCKILSSTGYDCDVSKPAWESYWGQFRSKENFKITLCQKAVVEMGAVW